MPSPKSTAPRFSTSVSRYIAAVEWIALNDSPADGPDATTVESYVSVKLVADVFGFTPARVAVAVCQVRDFAGQLERLRETLHDLKPALTGEALDREVRAQYDAGVRISGTEWDR